MSLLAQEIKQNRPFRSLEEEALLNLARTFEVNNTRLGEFLRQFDLTYTQYNVLRILRGAGEAGLKCSEVSSRMVNHDPDVTRLMDRLERRGWVVRKRSNKDRRVVLVAISVTGLTLLSGIDVPLAQFLAGLGGHMGPERLGQLIALLEDWRRGQASVPTAIAETKTRHPVPAVRD
ncbi:MAG: MarR family transcriptional regulator [Acidobacteria bacterium]|nr:MarR family transcriptional regulator [Acidobacteriota bacterium]